MVRACNFYRDCPEGQDFDTMLGNFDGILDGILDRILNEIASAFSKPRNDGIPQ